MKKYPGIWLSVLIAGLCLFSLPAWTQPVAERDFHVIDPVQPTDDPNRIEVVEFFSFACPHCYDLDPLLQEWKENLPRDVFFRRVPVSFNPFYELMAKLFYTLDATGDLERLDSALFDALHKERLKLFSEKDITEWAVAQGVDARRFSEAWNSFSVNSKVKRADQVARGYRIDGVPAIVVDGRYQVTSGSLLELPDMTDRIVAMRRAERKETDNGKGK